MPNTDPFELLGEDSEPDMDTLETLFRRVPVEPTNQESLFQEKACPVCGGSRVVLDEESGQFNDCPERCWEIES
jgi:hypothetical protein